MSAHTPGPWTMEGNKSRGEYELLGANGHLIADVQMFTGAKDERLIAAAPELLEALTVLLLTSENADETGYVVDVGFIDIEAAKAKAREVIAKAEGK